MSSRPKILSNLFYDQNLKLLDRQRLLSLPEAVIIDRIIKIEDYLIKKHDSHYKQKLKEQRALLKDILFQIFRQQEESQQSESKISQKIQQIKRQIVQSKQKHLIQQLKRELVILELKLQIIQNRRQQQRKPINILKREFENNFDKYMNIYLTNLAGFTLCIGLFLIFYFHYYIDDKTNFDSLGLEKGYVQPNSLLKLLLNYDTFEYIFTTYLLDFNTLLCYPNGPFENLRILYDHYKKYLELYIEKFRPGYSLIELPFDVKKKEDKELIDKIFRNSHMLNSMLRNHQEKYELIKKNCKVYLLSAILDKYAQDFHTDEYYSYIKTHIRYHGNIIFDDEIIDLYKRSRSDKCDLAQVYYKKIITSEEIPFFSPSYNNFIFY
jgi:hypothetical protein